MNLEKQITSAFKRGKEREYERLLSEARRYRATARLLWEHGADSLQALYIDHQLAVINAKVYLGRAKRLRQMYGLTFWTL
jgi:hypothetical protein